ncbi:MAG: hypothetical protein KGH76_02940 [Thaumarchaeota archaeon]|nr:hypothetical protein [Nitrososphaerota archaeon]
MSGGNLNTVSLLHQMGYPSLHEIMPIFQYCLMGFTVAGMGIMSFGLVAKKISKSISVKLVTEKSEDLQMDVKPSISKKEPLSDTSEDKVAVGVVSDVLTKLETELKEMKVGYENHKQHLEVEKTKLEQKEREKMAKIISAGEVMIREIAPDKFNDRVLYYVNLKNEETGNLVDLSLLAEKFKTMKKTMDVDDEIFSTSSGF